MIYATVTAKEGQRDDRVAHAIRFAAEANAAYVETGNQYEHGMCDGAIHALRALYGTVCPEYYGSHLVTVYTDDCKYTITYEAKEEDKNG